MNYFYSEEKDYDIYIAKIRDLLYSIKFTTILISKNMKFIFIFSDIALIFINIFKLLKNYILKNGKYSKKIL